MGYSSRASAIELEPAFPPIEWEEAACPMCGNPDWSYKLEAPARPGPGSPRWFQVVQCPHCGLCFTNPRPSPECLSRLYPPSVPPLGAALPITPPRWWNARAADPLAPFWPILERGQLLDVGCGIGPFLRRLQERGRVFTAVNLSAPAVDFLQQGWHVSAFVGTLPHPDLADNVFDVITMFDVLEHVHRPLEVLESAHERLAPGGVLVLAVPNLASLPFQWFGANWLGLDLPRHLTHFTPRTLRLMLHRAGFRIQRLSLLRHSSWLRSSARRACRQGNAPTWSPLLRPKALASVAGWYTALLRRANGMLAIALKS